MSAARPATRSSVFSPVSVTIRLGSVRQGGRIDKAVRHAAERPRAADIARFRPPGLAGVPYAPSTATGRAFIARSRPRVSRQLQSQPAWMPGTWQTWHFVHGSGLLAESRSASLQCVCRSGLQIRVASAVLAAADRHRVSQTSQCSHASHGKPNQGDSRIWPAIACRLMPQQLNRPSGKQGAESERG